jgi:hypothetical protein
MCGNYCIENVRILLYKNSIGQKKVHELERLRLDIRIILKSDVKVVGGKVVKWNYLTQERGRL